MTGIPRWRAALVVLAAVLSGADAAIARIRKHVDRDRADPYKQVGATTEASADFTPIVGSSSAYLIATFPTLKQVAYLQLPDNVWRPLVIGDVTGPKGVAVDGQSKRVYVSEPSTGVIWCYPLRLGRNNLLETIPPRIAAVEGYAASWLAVNALGDLYFTGRPKDGSVDYDSIYRQDASSIARGDSLFPVQVYERSNTGNPDPQAWNVSGIAVDSFFVYWGNEDQGSSHGSVVKGARQNVGLIQSEVRVTQLSNAVNQVSGVCATGTNLFYLTPDGVYGMPKTTPTTISDPSEGLIAVEPPGADNSTRWNPTGIAWDGESTVYFTDSAQGKVYSLPSLNTARHDLTKFVDAPGISGISIISFHSQISHGHTAALSWAPILAAAMALFFRS